MAGKSQRAGKNQVSRLGVAEQLHNGHDERHRRLGDQATWSGRSAEQEARSGRTSCLQPSRRAEQRRRGEEPKGTPRRNEAGGAEVNGNRAGMNAGQHAGRPECRSCSTPGVKNGTTRHGKQGWRCPACGRQWSAGPDRRRVHPEVARIAERMLGRSMDAGLVAELCGVSRSWVYQLRDRIGVARV